ncbi:lactococcin 972 family bacteriocin [Streptomyces sp. NPDC087859]|uniref:lactococcin 972 family bacteriocin n=1 Tax=Streptomyces sp. NPDC087859 TaxID=3365812 RepID=UPI00381F21E0
MTPSSKRFAFTAVTAALIAGVLTPASPANAEESEPTEWGMAAIEVDPTSTSVTPMSAKLVGGGVWSYGTELTSSGKRCWSHYYHDSKKHSATAKISVFSTKVYASAGNTAKASETWGAAYTCYVYWGVY